MASAWTLTDIEALWRQRRQGVTFRRIVANFESRYSADSIQDAWWATVNRTPEQALERANRAVFHAIRHTPMINFKPDPRHDQR